MRDIDRHQFRAPRRGVIGDAEQRGIAQTQFVAAAGFQEVRQTHTRSRAVEIGNVALEPYGAGLPLAHAEMIARRLALQPDQRVGGRIDKARHPVGPPDMDEVALDRCHGADLYLRRIDPGQRANPGGDNVGLR